MDQRNISIGTKVRYVSDSGSFYVGEVLEVVQRLDHDCYYRVRLERAWKPLEIASARTLFALNDYQGAIDYLEDIVDSIKSSICSLEEMASEEETA